MTVEFVIVLVAGAGVVPVVEAVVVVNPVAPKGFVVFAVPSGFVESVVQPGAAKGFVPPKPPPRPPPIPPPVPAVSPPPRLPLKLPPKPLNGVVEAVDRLFVSGDANVGAVAPSFKGVVVPKMI